jgi:hypothetical protein
MSTYTTNYNTRYGIPSLQQQTEVAMVSSASYIQIESPDTPDHANRLLWANWALKNSSIAWLPFAWPVTLDPTITAAVEADPTGATVEDASVNAVIGAALPKIVADFIANPPFGVTVPPPPGSLMPVRDAPPPPRPTPPPV